jgi:hypothetical protein
MAPMHPKDTEELEASPSASDGLLFPEKSSQSEQGRYGFGFRR